MSELRILTFAELDLVAGGEINIHADRVSIGEVSTGNGAAAPRAAAATNTSASTHMRAFNFPGAEALLKFLEEAM